MESRRLRLIQFVTARQAELRGLHAAAFGLWLVALLGVLLRLAPLTGPRAAKGFAIFLAATVPGIAQRALGRWYDTRFGRVGPSTVPQPFVPWMLLLSGIALDVGRLTPLAGRSGFLLVLAAYGIAVAARDYPWRLHHLGGIVVLLAAPAAVAVPRAGGADVDLSSFFASYAVGGAWLALSGLADHWLLCRSIAALKARSPERQRST